MVRSKEGKDGIEVLCHAGAFIYTTQTGLVTHCCIEHMQEGEKVMFWIWENDIKLIYRQHTFVQSSEPLICSHGGLIPCCHWVNVFLVRLRLQNEHRTRRVLSNFPSLSVFPFYLYPFSQVTILLHANHSVSHRKLVSQSGVCVCMGNVRGGLVSLSDKWLLWLERLMFIQ